MNIEHIILNWMQSWASAESNSFSSLFNLPYSKDIHYFIPAMNIANTTATCQMYVSIFVY